MSGDQLMGMLRALIPGLVAALAHYGIGTTAQDTFIATAVATGLVAAWSTWTNSQTSMIKAVNTADNGVKVVSNTVLATPVTGPLK